jgi:hypothetical protein
MKPIRIKKPVKVALISLAGQIGKSTLGCHVLQGYLPEGTRRIAVESHKDSCGAQEHVSATLEGIKTLQSAILNPKYSAIVDFGLNEFNEAVKILTQFKHIFGFLTTIIVPVDNSVTGKSQTKATIELLKELGVPAGKILVIPNRVDFDLTLKAIQTDTKQIFADLETEVAATGARFLADAPVPKGFVIEQIRSFESEDVQPVAVFARNTTDFCAQLEDDSLSDEMREATIAAIALQSGARQMDEFCCNAFNQIAKAANW